MPLATVILALPRTVASTAQAGLENCLGMKRPIRKFKANKQKCNSGDSTDDSLVLQTHYLLNLMSFPHAGSFSPAG